MCDVIRATTWKGSATRFIPLGTYDWISLGRATEDQAFPTRILASTSKRFLVLLLVDQCGLQFHTRLKVLPPSYQPYSTKSDPPVCFNHFGHALSLFGAQAAGIYKVNSMAKYKGLSHPERVDQFRILSWVNCELFTVRS